MPDEAKNEREMTAKRALIANALSPVDLDNISDDEILDLLGSCVALTEEAKQALADFGSTPFRSRREKEEARTEQESRSSAPLQSSGMYRLGSDAEIDPSVQEEIDRKRQEILKKIKDQKKDV